MPLQDGSTGRGQLDIFLKKKNHFDAEFIILRIADMVRKVQYDSVYKKDTRLI